MVPLRYPAVYEIVQIWTVGAPGFTWAIRRPDGGFLPRTKRKDGFDIITDAVAIFNSQYEAIQHAEKVLAKGTVLVLL